MQCTLCKYPHSEVVYVTHDEKKDSTVRRRQCKRCGVRFTTLEKIKPPTTQKEKARAE